MTCTYDPEVDIEHEEIQYYSQINREQLNFTKEELRTFTPPKNLRRGEWNIKNGYRSFTPRVFGDDESMVRNLLLSVIQYESSHPDAPKPDILCHSGFFSDVVNRKQENYGVISYQGQLIIAGTNRRRGQDLLPSYVGIRFEDLVMNPGHRTLNNFEHFKTMTAGKIGDVTFQTVTEIDGCINDDKSPDGYTELKVTAAPGFPAHLGKNASAFTFLDMLRRSKSSRSFGPLLLKWINQCVFGMSTHLLVGTRSYSYDVLGVKLFNVKRDLLPYLRSHFPDQWIQYRESVDLIDTTVKGMLQMVKENPDDKVWRFSIYGDRTLFYPEKKLAESIYNNVMIKEFTDWRENNVNDLPTCPSIVGPQEKAKEPRRYAEEEPSAEEESTKQTKQKKRKPRKKKNKTTTTKETYERTDNHNHGSVPISDIPTIEEIRQRLEKTEIS